MFACKLEIAFLFLIEITQPYLIEKRLYFKKSVYFRFTLIQQVLVDYLPTHITL